MTPPSLSVAIVTYRTDPRMLDRCLRSLVQSVRHARAKALVGALDVFLVDNGPPRGPSSIDAVRAAWPADAGALHVRSGHGNVGYGEANNLVLADLGSDVHLVMNPDVELAPDAVGTALATLAEHPDVGLLAPRAVDGRGEPQYLCKRYPSVWVLFLRGFAPPSLRRRHAAAIHHYEMRDVMGDAFIPDVALASGCFMAMRTALYRKVGGFDPRYFMYFEDYDLSLRLARCARVAYAPQVRIVHHGGEAAAKGLRHILWFARSAVRFFSTHGWKLA